jgi:hypothetical protein
MAKSVHKIAADGTVSPSFVCPHPGCGFHEFIVLSGWPGNSTKLLGVMCES